MKDLRYLYDVAEENNIPIIPFPLKETGSISIQDEDKACYIGLDEHTINTESEQKVHLAHELGHCVTGSFYNRYSPLDVRQKHEYRANKWAVKHLISEAELDEAVAEGCTEIWSLAEYFNVTEDFMKMVVCWHVHGNLSAELYF